MGLPTEFSVKNMTKDFEKGVDNADESGYNTKAVNVLVWLSR